MPSVSSLPTDYARSQSKRHVAESIFRKMGRKAFLRVAGKSSSSNNHQLREISGIFSGNCTAKTLSCQNSAIRNLFGFLGLPETGISQKLLNEVIRARVGSSFRDTGRLIESNENQLICALFDKQIEAVLHDVASMRALDAIQNWYPTLCRDF